jgi:hypothetical protein
MESQIWLLETVGGYNERRWGMEKGGKSEEREIQRGIRNKKK